MSVRQRAHACVSVRQRVHVCGVCVCVFMCVKQKLRNPPSCTGTGKLHWHWHCCVKRTRVRGYVCVGMCVCVRMYESVRQPERVLLTTRCARRYDLLSTWYTY